MITKQDFLSLMKKYKKFKFDNFSKKYEFIKDNYEIIIEFASSENYCFKNSQTYIRLSLFDIDNDTIIFDNFIDNVFLIKEILKIYYKFMNKLIKLNTEIVKIKSMLNIKLIGD
jgi:hypothetical protein